MVKIGLATLALSVMLAGGTSAKTYVASKLINPPGPGKVLVQKKIVKKPSRRPHVVGTRRIHIRRVH